MNFTPPPDKAFGSIAYNEEDKIIVLNTNYLFCDGGFFKFLMSSYTDHIESKEIPHFPRFISDVFKEQIERAPDMIPFVNDENMTHGKNYNFTNNVIDDKSNNQRKFLDEFELRIPVNEYKSYNPQKNTPEHLTEYLWLSHCFAAGAYEGKPFTSFKIRTVNDLRKYLPHPDFLNCYHCAVFPPSVPSISLDDILSKVGAELKKDLLRLNTKQAHISNLKTVANVRDICQGVDLGITSVGTIKIRRPILDAHCSILANATKAGNLSILAGSLYFMCFSSLNKTNPRNEITTKTMHNSNIFPREVVNQYLRRTRYILTQVSLDQTVGEVFDKIMKID